MTVRNTKAEQARRSGQHPKDIPKPAPKPRTETQISASIRAWLGRIGAIPTRVNSGTVQIEGRWIQMAPKGTSDMLSALPVIVPGFGLLAVYLAIEVKRPGGKPTPEQDRFLARIRVIGGIAFAADGLKSAQAQLIAALAERGLLLAPKQE